MNPAPDVFTTLVLPFDVQLGRRPLFASGQDVVVECSLSKAAGGEAELATVFDRFARLARTGALGSPIVEPASSCVGDVVVASNRAVFRGCRVDERGVVVLAHLLFGQQKKVGLRSVRMTVVGSPGALTERLEYRGGEQDSSYPERPVNLPFVVDDLDPDGDSRTFTAEFEKDVEPGLAASLSNSLIAWADVVRAGGYAVAGVPPETGYLEPETPTCWGSGLEYAVSKLRASGQCTEGVVNILAAFDRRACRLRSLAIG
jgi:hypothetical protein